MIVIHINFFGDYSSIPTIRKSLVDSMQDLIRMHKRTDDKS